MMTNLFSVFDPSTSLVSFPWILALILPLVAPALMWSPLPPKSTLVKTMSLAMVKEIHFSSKKKSSQAPIIISLFLTILLMNVSALYPQVFSLSSHLTMTLPLALLSWLMINLFGWSQNVNHMLSHLVPQGTPAPLMAFMVLIELSSNMIRPITLCVRLTANMIAGHLLMSLLGNAVMGLPLSMTFISIMVPVALTVLETAVAVIQAYVFMTLITLYMSESI